VTDATTAAPGPLNADKKPMPLALDSIPTTPGQRFNYPDLGTLATNVNTVEEDADAHAATQP
jgi:hypothetical protein